MTQKTFKYRPGRSFGIPAQVAGERLEDIRKAGKGRLTPAAVVEDASDPQSPLHPVFPWNDAEAAQKHREDIARTLMSSVMEVHVSIGPAKAGPTEHYAYVSIGQPKAGGACYVSTADAVASPDMQQILKDQALAQLAGWQRRYTNILGLPELVAALQSLADEAAEKSRMRPKAKGRQLAKADRA